MAERKPPDQTFETWIDKQIREAAERGEFDNLRGAGRPIPPGAADEDWWLRDYLKREGLGADALLPESIILRRERERIRETVRDMRSEREVRDTVAALNERIVAFLRMPTGPHIPVAPLQTDQVVDRWRADRNLPHSPSRSPAPPPPSTGSRRSWWRRILR